MPDKRNRPTCVLCRDDQLRTVRIGVWLCKHHWRLLCRFARLVQPTMLRQAPDHDELITILRRVCGNAT